METHSVSSLLLDLATVAGLILLAALFVAAEIALISLRESQIRQIAGRGKRGARVAKLAENHSRCPSWCDSLGLFIRGAGC